MFERVTLNEDTVTLSISRSTSVMGPTVARDDALSTSWPTHLPHAAVPGPLVTWLLDSWLPATEVASTQKDPAHDTAWWCRRCDSATFSPMKSRTVEVFCEHKPPRLATAIFRCPEGEVTPAVRAVADVAAVSLTKLCVMRWEASDCNGTAHKKEGDEAPSLSGDAVPSLSQLQQLLKTFRNDEPADPGEEIAETLTRFTSLRELTLSESKLDGALTLLGKSLAAPWTTLRTACFFASTVTGVGVSALPDIAPNLERLALTECETLGDDAAPSIARLTSLVELGLMGTKITNATVLQLEPCRCLRSLDLFGARLTDDAATGTVIAGLPQLETLTLTATGAGDVTMSTLSASRSLTMLDCNNVTALSDVGLAHLAKCTPLKCIAVRTTNVSAVGVRALMKLPHLELVRASRTQLSGDDAEALTTARTTVSVTG